MSHDNVALPPPTDFADPPKQQKPTGKGSKQKRKDTYRSKMNVDADAAIQAGIFARLKIKDPTLVASTPLAKEANSSIVPVSFSKIPQYVDKIWNSMEAIGPRPFAEVNSPANKMTFTKGILLLCEAKVCCAQRKVKDKPDEPLVSRNLYTTEQLLDLASMASVLPYPLAILLESIGVAADGPSSVVPVLAEYRDLGLLPLSGALTYAPSQLLPLLALLREGVPTGNVVHQVALALDGAPGIMWEQFVRPVDQVDVEHVRLTEVSINFWTDNNNDVHRIKWTDSERNIFMKIVKSVASRHGFLVTYDLLHGDGSLAQVVQTNNWTIDLSTYWFTTCNVSDYDIKLGVAFGLSPDAEVEVQKSRFRGCRELAYWRGEITPRRIVDNILTGLE